MRENVINDSTDSATKRPNSPPLKKTGSLFSPMKIPDFGYEIQLPPDTSYNDPISLFELYYSSEVMKHITKCTNTCLREPKHPEKPRCRALNWYPTSRAELYIYLGIRIYMTLHIENELSDYWSSNNMIPIHPITSEMSIDRFLELYMRFRCYGPEAEGLYAKVVFKTPKKFQKLLELGYNIVSR